MDLTQYTIIGLVYLLGDVKDSDIEQELIERDNQFAALLAALKQITDDWYDQLGVEYTLARDAIAKAEGE